MNMNKAKMAWLGIFLGLFFLTGAVSASANPLQVFVKAGFKEVFEKLTKQRSKELVEAYIRAGGDLSKEALERATREAMERAWLETGEFFAVSKWSPAAREIFKQGVRKAGFKGSDALIERLFFSDALDSVTRFAFNEAAEQANREVAREIQKEVIDEALEIGLMNAKRQLKELAAQRTLKRAPVPVP
jgi:hypothetical protein